MNFSAYEVEFEQSLRSREPDIVLAAEVILKMAILTGSLQATVLADDRIVFIAGGHSHTVVIENGRSLMRTVLARLASMCRRASGNRLPEMLLYGGEGKLKRRLHGEQHLLRVSLQNTTASQHVTVAVDEVSKLSALPDV